jgi:uridylate kinase
MSLTRAKREYIVLSVGGSLIVPGEIDVAFLQSFRAFILDHVRRGFSFFIIIGGGHTARAYQKAGSEARGDLHPEDIDWLGIHATRMNAHLMRALFLGEAQARIVKNPSRKIMMKKSIIIGAGWKPGWSTDYCAVMAAKKLGAKRMVNLSNIDAVYTADPKKDPEAKKIDSIGWDAFRKLIPDHWDPGLSSPFDPIAAREAERLGLEVAVMNGKNLDAFGNYLDGKPFSGTVIK